MFSNTLNSSFSLSLGTISPHPQFAKANATSPQGEVKLETFLCGSFSYGY